MTKCIESDGNELYIGDDPYWRGRALKAEADLIELRDQPRDIPRDLIGERDETWQTVPKIPTERMLIGARNALRNLIDSVPETERAARWGLPGPRGYAIPTDEKHAARYRGMLANAPTPSTSLRDRLADRERKLTEVCRERDEWKARAERAEAALRNGLSYEELRGAFDAFTTLYEAALARAMSERDIEEIKAAAKPLLALLLPKASCAQGPTP